MAAFVRQNLSRLLFCLAAMTLVIDGSASQAARRESPPPVYPVTYAIVDLPVYRLDRDAKKGFDPSVLLALIKTSIDPASWEADAEISVFPQNLSIVVSQTEANHEQVAKLLESLRSANAPPETR